MTAPKFPSIRTGQTARALLLGLVAIFSASTGQLVQAQTWYQVEVIVFDEPGSDGYREESWPENPGRPDLARCIELADSDGLNLLGEDGVPHAFRLIEPAELTMRGAWARLSRSGQFRPLAHLGWYQPGLGPRAARAVHLIAWGKPTGSGARLGLSPLVDGTLRIYRTRFLHAEIDLLYRPSGGTVLRNDSVKAQVDSGATAEADGGAEGPAFRLATRRKMRSEELHYIDHPLFGLLIKVVPLKPTEPGAS